MADATYSGERFDPDGANALAHADHHARYHFVKGSFPGGRLLDVGCGLGVGAAFLADAYAEVRGVDASAEAVAQARRDRSSARLAFSTIEGLRAEGPPRFDVVTCLEVIEHTFAQAPLLELVSSFLADDGVAIVSTPNREWTQRKQITNPFHVKELHEAEFFALVESVFPHVQRWHQVQVQGAIVVASGAPADVATHFSGPRAIDRPYRAADVTNFVAVCSKKPRAPARAVSVLDPACTYEGELGAVIRDVERRVDDKDRLLREQDALVEQLKAELRAVAVEKDRLAERIERLRRLEEWPDEAARPLRWRLADRANDALKKTPIHRALKKVLGR